MGNLMSQYATLYAHAKLLGAQGLVTPYMRTELLKFFPHLSLPPAKEVSNCPWNWLSVSLEELTKDSFFTVNDKNETVKRNVMISNYPFDVENIQLFRQQLVGKEFVLSKGLKSVARAFLRKVAKTRGFELFGIKDVLNKTAVKIGTH